MWDVANSARNQSKSEFPSSPTSISISPKYPMSDSSYLHQSRLILDDESQYISQKLPLNVYQNENTEKKRHTWRNAFLSFWAAEQIGYVWSDKGYVEFKSHLSQAESSFASAAFLRQFQPQKHLNDFPKHLFAFINPVTMWRFPKCLNNSTMRLLDK